MQGYDGLSKKEKRIYRRNMRSSKRLERFYKNNFIMFEIGYILLAIPMLVIAFSSVPLLMFYTLSQEFHLWPIIVVCILVVFSQISAVQFFVRKYYLDYHKMSLGEFLRYKYENRKMQLITEDNESVKEDSWYEGLDEMIERVKNRRQEQTTRIYTQVYGNIVE